MTLFRNDATVTKDKFEAPVNYYSDIRRGLREKANHNKRESEIGFFLNNLLHSGSAPFCNDE
jgi:hypothetical protein